MVTRILCDESFFLEANSTIAGKRLLKQLHTRQRRAATPAVIDSQGFAFSLPCGLYGTSGVPVKLRNQGPAFLLNFVQLVAVDGGVPHDDLSRKLDARGSRVSKLARILGDLKMVSLKTSKADRRRNRISLRDVGRDFLDSMTRRLNQQLRTLRPRSVGGKRRSVPQKGQKPFDLPPVSVFSESVRSDRRADCESGSKILGFRAKLFKTQAEAVQQDFMPCKVCMPDRNPYPDMDSDGSWNPAGCSCLHTTRTFLECASPSAAVRILVNDACASPARRCV